MTIRLNGEPHEIGGPIPVSGLLETLGIDSRRVAIEHNMVVVKRDAYATTIISEGDEVEIVNFVGGGLTARIRTEQGFGTRDSGLGTRD